MSDSMSLTNDLYGVNNPITVNTPFEENNKSISMENFLQLMIAEIQNQDFNEPVDSSAYITQLAQISAMQQMEQVAYYSKTNYVVGLVGQEVTVAKLGLGGKVQSVTGTVEKVTLADGEYGIYVNGTSYKLSQVMTIAGGGKASDNTQMEQAASSSTPYLLERDSERLKLAWNPPEDADEKDYTYRVYYSEDSAFDTVDEVKNGNLVGEYTNDDELIAEIDGLEAGTPYYVNIIISNGTSEYAYQKLATRTKTQ